MAQQGNISELTSSTIAALRFPLIAGIVLVHCGVLGGIEVGGVVYGANPPYWLQCVGRLFSDELARIGVQLFFLLSGYLFFTGLTAESYRGKLRRRVRTLLVPYLLWNALAMLKAAVHSIPAVSALYPGGYEAGNWSVLTVLASFWDNRYGVFPSADAGSDLLSYFTAPVAEPMWFVRNLMVAALLSPLLHWLLRRLGWWLVAALGTFYVFTYGNSIAITAFFYSWGACIALKGHDLVRHMRRFGCAPWLYALIAIADVFTKSMPWSNTFHKLGIIVGVFAVISVTATLVEKRGFRANPFLAGSCFFVYATHMMLMGFVIRAITAVMIADSPAYFLALYFLVPAVTVLVCLGLYWLMRRLAPRVTALLTGGR